jgi:transglutaminase-like putative cysteine protease
MLYRMIGLCCVVLALAATTRAAGDVVPAWLQQAAALNVPAYDKDVHAVVLHDEATVTVGEDGRQTTVTTWAVRILHREGRGYAYASTVYATDSGKVRELRAWLIRPNGSVKSYGKDETLDEAAALNDVYNEARVKSIKAGNDAEPGAVFGYQIITEERAEFNQHEWFFQSYMPVLRSRLTLTLPGGWQATSVTFNHAPLEPTMSGSAYTWELRDLAPIEDEPASPTMRNLAARIAMSYAPANAAAAGGRNYKTWTDVSRWYSGLSDPQATADDAVAQKARELTAGAKTELERIQAIGRYVQSLQYISIQIGIGRFRPHAAAEVYAKKYGDCKDKANLMRAMLAAIGIQSYPVLIRSGDPTYVREEWTSPGQFNHCIVAVRVSDATQVPSVMQHPQLGRLLIFDATDDDTPVGDLPEHEQNSFALIAAGDAGMLVRMPITPPEANQLERQAEVSLAPDGSITATLHERSVGQAAAQERAGFHHLARPAYNQMIASWITLGATGAKVTKVEPVDQNNEGRFALDVEFAAERYGQLMQERLLVFKPAIVSRRESLELTAAARKHPVVLRPYAYSETVKVKLPAGFDVDELPDAVKLDAPFGTYAATYAVKDGQLQFTRTLVQRATTIPVEQYATVRTFFERIRAAEQAPVVLARK